MPHEAKEREEKEEVAEAEAEAEANGAEDAELVFVPTWGGGVLERVADGRAAVRLSFGVVHLPESRVVREAEVGVTAFLRGMERFAVRAGAAQPLAELVKAAAAHFKVDPDEVRLVHGGREVPREWDARPLARCRLRLPGEVLLVLDETSSFELDRRHRGDDIEIGPDGLSATVTSQNRWRTVRGDREITEGRLFWDVRLDRCQTGNMFIGLCTRGMKMNNYCGNDETSFGYYGCSNVYHGGASKKYGEPFRCGDMIRVLLDMDARTLSFSKNGADLGLAYDGLPPAVYPAFSLYSQEDEFHLVSFGSE